MEQTLLTVYIKPLVGELIQLDDIPAGTRHFRALRAKLNEIDPAAFPYTHLYLTRMEPHEPKEAFRHGETFLLVVGGCRVCQKLCSKPTAVHNEITVVDHVGGEEGYAFSTIIEDGNFPAEEHFQVCEEDLRTRWEAPACLYVGDTVLVHTIDNITQIRVRPGIFVSVAAHIVFRYKGGEEWQRYLFLVEETGDISHDYRATSDFLAAICHDVRHLLIDEEDTE